MAYIPNELLSRLVGCRLFSVVFVMDYVQLCFDSHISDLRPTLTCDIFPVVHRAAGRIRQDEVGYGDALRSFITEHVVATAEAFEAGLRVEFPAGAITLRPTYDELVGPEIATLSGFPDKSWMTWRPGEDAFEYFH
ncbi:hypothetical protein [Nocardia pseudobrasiliensis]|uniref:Uncharacterized protein n=1 Tax=Nocardia pseudobrasiliensis TaxID=45979 RepID=A0A370IEC4_9NOCA|nr:hypothetical protein [Nocardia pseudobrasiliensis]RDI69077.1 hypothetical protein DFR76_101615 [Nocardia pseudobrasiliensis]